MCLCDISVYLYTTKNGQKHQTKMMFLVVIFNINPALFCNISIPRKPPKQPSCGSENGEWDRMWF
tara:strand:- start:3236 stop:3430 length:195 start_codon:yes stop_codon:yes gene_type:complete